MTIPWDTSFLKLFSSINDFAYNTLQQRLALELLQLKKGSGVRQHEVHYTSVTVNYK